MVYNIPVSLFIIFILGVIAIVLKTWLEINYSKMNQEKPDKKENWVDSLLKAGALIGGAWILVEILKMLSKEVYRCPNCKKTFEEKYSSNCPYCKVKLKWKI